MSIHWPTPLSNRSLNLVAARASILVSTLCLLLTGGSDLEAQSPPVPLSSPFVVNTWTYGDQYMARVATQPNGAFIVVWENRSGEGDPLDDRSVQMRRFTSSGTPLGDQIQVNAYTTSTQGHPDLALQSNGDFVVVWRSYGSPGNDINSWSIQGRHFASDGSALGDQFQINSYSTGNQIRPRIAVDGADRFLVVWEGDAATSNPSIQGRRFDATAQPLGGEFAISTITNQEDKTEAEVAMAPDGGFVVVWEGRYFNGDDPSEESIQARRFDSLGAPFGPQFLVNSYTTGSQRRPSVDMLDNGAFMIVWDSERSTNGDGDRTSVQAQRYNSLGALLGEPFIINSGAAGFQFDPSIRYGKANDFVVVWTNYPVTGDPFRSLKGRRFSASGDPLSSDFTLSTGETVINGEDPHLAFDGQGHFVAVWHSSSVTDDDIWGYGVRARRYCNPECLFADGFESGDTAGWINAVGN